MAATISDSNVMLNFSSNRSYSCAKPTKLKCRGDDDVVGLEAVDVGGATQVPCWGKALGNSVDGMDLGWRLSGVEVSSWLKMPLLLAVLRAHAP
ncbi:uncharacterized protein PG998_007419 [Apiospora kogelbergensis]|uniref:uncharacterized protein n=1 Tax=Apiospora kogelbergensis TaxID=1337665 RepID=UPI00312D1060